MKNITKKEKIQYSLIGGSILFVILGLLFMINAMEVANIFPAFYAIENTLAKYIVVILCMACGIMTFSNVALTFENKKLRNGLTIGITTFATVLTLPLVYVFIAIFPLQANGTLGPIGEIMALDRILEGFHSWFGADGGTYAVLSIMLLVSIVFIAFPLITGILAVKGKAIKIGKQENGKFGVSIGVLPIIEKMEALKS